MASVGLRELRQDASELVRRAEAGEEVVITVSGRAAAVLGPARKAQWRRYDDLAALFDTPVDPTWEEDRRRMPDVPVDPWVNS
jgi:prevent-host-death family protein